MGKEFLELPTIDFLKEITKTSLNNYKQSSKKHNIEVESGKTSLELQFDSNDLCALLKKFEESKTDVAENKILLGYIDYYSERIRKLINKEENSTSAYDAYPQYGEQYFSLIYEVLNNK